jgi:hypothetical protein
MMDCANKLLTKALKNWNTPSKTNSPKINKAQCNNASGFLVEMIYLSTICPINFGRIGPTIERVIVQINE